MSGEDGVAVGDVVRALDERLDVARYTEPESNGLIVSGRDQVRRVAAAVNTSLHAEKLGVQGLAALLEERFGLPWEFIPEQEGIL